MYDLIGLAASVPITYWDYAAYSLLCLWRRYAG